MRGRKPKPAAVKRAEGNRGKRRLPPVVSSAQTALATAAGHTITLLEPPDYLDQAARDEWLRVAADLQHLGVELDGLTPLLTVYATAWSRWREVEGLLAQLRAKGGQALLVGSSKQVQINPLQFEARALAKQIKELLTELGLTPSAKERVRQQRTATAADELLAYVAARARDQGPTILDVEAATPGVAPPDAPPDAT